MMLTVYTQITKKKYLSDANISLRFLLVMVVYMAWHLKNEQKSICK